MEQVDRFENQKEIGSGTYGTVFSAFDHDLDRNVAIK